MKALDCNSTQLLDYESILILDTKIETVDTQLRDFPVLQSSTAAMTWNEQRCRDGYVIVKDEASVSVPSAVGYERRQWDAPWDTGKIQFFICKKCTNKRIQFYKNNTQFRTVPTVLV
jgi:hypothetical protein